MATLPENLDITISGIKADSIILHEIVHGPNGQTVTTDGGPVKTAATIISDADAAITPSANAATQAKNEAVQAKEASEDAKVDAEAARDVALQYFDPITGLMYPERLPSAINARLAILSGTTAELDAITPADSELFLEKDANGKPVSLRAGGHDGKMGGYHISGGGGGASGGVLRYLPEMALNEILLEKGELAYNSDTGRIHIGDGVRYGGEDPTRRNGTPIQGHVMGGISVISMKSDDHFSMAYTISDPDYSAPYPDMLGVRWWDGTVETTPNFYRDATLPSAVWAKVPKTVNMWVLGGYGRFLTILASSPISLVGFDFRGLELLDDLDLAYFSVDEMQLPQSKSHKLEPSSKVKYINIPPVETGVSFTLKGAGADVVRAVGVEISGGGINIDTPTGNPVDPLGPMTATAINRLFHDLAPCGPTARQVRVENQIGSADCDPTIASDKGYLVFV